MVAELLYEWQTLIGAALGGVFALFAALVVAYRAERRSDLAAGMHLVSTLAAVCAAGRQLDKLAAEKELTSPADRAAWQAERLARFRPKLSPFFEGSMARVMPLDTTAAAHLALFHSQYIALDDKLQRIEGYIEKFESGHQLEHEKERLIAYATSAKSTFDMAVLHADCAEHLLEKFVLSKRALWNRLWYRWLPDARTRRCRDMLKGSKSLAGRTE